MRQLKEGIMLKLLITFCLFFSHEFYISVTQIDHNAKNESLEITVKMFTDDLENAIESFNDVKLRLGGEKEHEASTQLIQDYVLENLELSQNGKDIQLSFIGKKVDLDVTWCFLEAKDVKSISSLTVENNLLLNVIESQTNIVHVKYQNENSSLMLNKKNTRDEVLF